MARQPTRWLVSAWLCASLVAVGVAESPASWTGDLAPIAPSDWTYDRAAHLIERAGFGGTPEEIERLASLDAAAGRRPPRRLRGASTTARHARSTNRASGIAAWIRFRRAAPKPCAWRANAAKRSAYARCPRARRAASSRSSTSSSTACAPTAIETQRLGVWWANRMLTTNRPLEEKLTLFWHGHFATGDAKVRDYRMMLRQNEMLRANASGRLRDLLVGILEGSGDARVPRQRRERQERIRTRTSAASCSSCSRWASATTPSATSARPRARSPAGPTTSSRSSSTRSSTTSARRRSSGRPARSTARTSSTRSSTQPVTAEFVSRRRSTGTSCATRSRRP